MRNQIVILLLFLAHAFCNARSEYVCERTQETWLLGAGLLVNGVGGWLCHNVTPPDPDVLLQSDVFIADRIALRCDNQAAAHLSDWLLLILSLGPLTMTAHENSEDGNWSESCIYLESQLWTIGLTHLCKGVFKRPRPYVYAGSCETGERDASRSFFSGYTSVAFAGAVSAGIFYDHFHPNSRWNRTVWMSGLSLATITGALRILAGKHFPTDVLAGAMVGSLIGWAIPRIHEKDDVPNHELESGPVLIQFQVAL